MHVLVADDNAINLHVVLAMLKRCGCTTVTAQDGVEALTALQRENFDLVLMDCHMPNMDGFEATRRLRSMEGAAASTRVVALTASALPEELAQCRAAGSADDRDDVRDLLAQVDPVHLAANDRSHIASACEGGGAGWRHPPAPIVEPPAATLELTRQA